MLFTPPAIDTSMPARVGLVVVQSTTMVFVGYLAVGLEAAVVPTFVDRGLGLGAMLAGLALGSQAFATLTSRASAGGFTDRFGARLTIIRGMYLMLVSGLLFCAATISHHEHPVPQFSVLMASRLLLGWGISWVSAAGAVWGIRHAGEGNASKILVWSGVAANSALGLGAPIGLSIATHMGAPALGLCLAGLCLGGRLFAGRMPEVARVTAEPLHILAVMRRVAPYGTILGLTAAGYGVFSAFVTLFFQTQNWRGAAYPLALYGVVFVSTRILLGKCIDRYSVFRVGMISIGVELVALAMLANAHTAGMGLASACVMGGGYSLMFPTLCVQTIRRVGPRDRASAISVFTGFLELSLTVAAPLAGIVITHAGFRPAFWSAFFVVGVGFAGLWWLSQRTQVRAPAAS